MHFTERYAARTVHFLELWVWQGWRAKLYGIAYRGERPAPALVALARDAASACLPNPAVTRDRYGVAFIGVHAGRDADLVFVSWWCRENELRQRTFLSDASAPGRLADVTADGLVGCVWDLAVMHFERTAWIASVLLNPTEPDLERYLASRFEGAV